MPTFQTAVKPTEARMTGVSFFDRPMVRLEPY